MSRAAAGTALTVFISVFLTIGVSAGAQSFPTKPVRLVVGFSPGGGTDTIARVIGKKLAETWPYALVVENRPGA
ncbi:MAG: tripartite tricarboxylate transporter substrate binding protein, partial [Betaproteobacteria bacterium]|nr:tripartite tricarboxylate transporter substrate binding protein [Betaproteobacteria bacterium]